jgi:hypothetical protein
MTATATQRGRGGEPSAAAGPYGDSLRSQVNIECLDPYTPNRPENGPADSP